MTTAVEPEVTAPAPEEFNLHQVIVEVLASADKASPHDVVPMVAKRIPDWALRQAIAQLLPEAVRRVAGTLRRHAPSDEGERGRWRDVARFSRDIRRWRVALGPDEWKFLKDLTVEDCRVLASNYQEAALDNSRKAKSYSRLADVIEEQGVATAGQLSDEILAEVLR